MDKLFEIATRKKYRFPYKGLVSVEDLWDLSVQALDQIFKHLNKELKEKGEESLLKSKTDEETDLDNAINIVKYIVSVKEEERLGLLEQRKRAAKKQKIMEIMAEKQDKALTEMSMEDLQKMLDELD